MVKLTRSGKIVGHSSNCKRWGMLSVLVVFVGSMSFLLYSYFSHDAGNPLCNCVMCIFSRTPEDGEYVYNRYLIFISLIWIAVIFAIIFFANCCFVKKNKNKKRS